MPQEVEAEVKFYAAQADTFPLAVLLLWSVTSYFQYSEFKE